MGYSSLRTGILWRASALFATLVLAAWLTAQTHWYISILLCAAAALAQMVFLMQFATRSGREIARFLDAIAFDDASQSFAGLGADTAYRELGGAMTRVLDLLRISRTQREEQARHLQALLTQVPVALVSVQEDGEVQLLNMAARRLFDIPALSAAQFGRYGDAFATGMDALRPGSSAILRMERLSGLLQLKAAATDFSLGGRRCRLVSLQNIEIELSAQELVAWQTVIRVMAHEVMNSLTPISSLAATAQDLVREALSQSPAGGSQAATLADALEALETVTRRSEGLLHFVQNHRRLTKRLITQIDVFPVERAFARLQRLLAADFAARNIAFASSVEPRSLEVSADAELLDQALINLARNAIEALGADGRIDVRAYRDSDGHLVVAVADNGPGISLDMREKIFVPFFTTKRQGSGVGLTLVRQIASVHDATVQVSDTPGGGATIALRF
jgi:nitrogen fixation/metabolism regulation signal transduction histidine kinase